MEMQDYKCIICRHFFNGERFGESDLITMRDAFSDIGINIDEDENNPVAICYDCYKMFEKFALSLSNFMQDKREFIDYFCGITNNEKRLEN